MLNQSDKALLAHLRSQGIELTQSDLIALYRFWHACKQERLRLYEGRRQEAEGRRLALAIPCCEVSNLHLPQKDALLNPLPSALCPLPLVEVQDGKMALMVAGGVLGGLFLPGSFGITAWYVGALTGASIGYTLGNLIFGPKKPKEDPEFKQRYGFDGGGTLTPLGGIIPQCFCNRARNLQGGVLIGGYLLASYIETRADVQRLFQLYSLGQGPIQDVAEDKLLINDQERDTFYDDELLSEVKLGTAADTPPSAFGFYSQAVSPGANAAFGVDRKAEIKTTRSAQSTQEAVFTNLRGCYATGNALTKDGAATAWDAGASSSQKITASGTVIAQGTSNGQGYVEFRAGQTNKSIVVGFSSEDPNANYTSIDFAIQAESTNGYIRVYESGTQRYQSAANNYTTNDVLRIEYTSSAVVYKKNGSTFYTSTLSRVYPVYVDTSLNSQGAKILEVNIGIGLSKTRGRVNPSGVLTNSLTVDEDDFEPFVASERYQVVGTDGSTQEFRITSKTESTYTLSVTPQVRVDPEDVVYSYTRAKYETTKRVSELHLNLLFELWARNDKNELLYHGSLFGLYIRKKSAADFTFVQRFLAKANNPNGIRRSIRIKNLDLDKYVLELRPVPLIGDTSTIPVRKLSNDQTNFTTFSANGYTLQIEDGGIKGVEYVQQCTGYDDKEQVSTQNKPSGLIASVNEIVQPSAIGVTGSLFPKDPMLQVEVLGTQALNGSAPNIQAVISQGVECPMHLAAGFAGQSSNPTTLSDLGANFNDIALGYILRNLTRHAEAAITNKTANTLTTGSALNWKAGDRYLVYRIDSSNYFPDIAVFKLLQSKNNWTQRHLDNYVDYPRIVAAREFCDDNNFYWDGLLNSNDPWPQWVYQESLGQLLFPVEIDGRYGLIPEQEQPPKGLYNAFNMRNYKEEYVPLSERALNTVTLTYTDGSDAKFKEKTVTVMTTAAYNGTEDPVEESLNLKPITREAQAIRVAQVRIKSKQLQTKTVSFETDTQGVYHAPGDLFIIQHVYTAYKKELSSMVKAVDGEYVQIHNDVPTSLGNTYKAAILYRTDGSIQENMTVSLDGNKPGWIKVQGVNQSKLQVNDLINIGIETEKRLTYRAAKNTIDHKSRTCQIEAVLWTPEILNTDGLVTVN